MASLFLGTFACHLPGGVDDHGLTIFIDVAPKVVNLRFEMSKVTIHADIPWRTVEPARLVLRVDDDVELAITSTKSDACGDLVVKANWQIGDLGDDELVGLPDRGSADFTLDGMTTDGEPFSGTSTVRVIVAGE